LTLAYSGIGFEQAPWPYLYKLLIAFVNLRA